MADRQSLYHLCARIVSPIYSLLEKIYDLLSRMAGYFQRQNPPQFFTHKLFGFAMLGILALLKVVSAATASSPPVQFNPILYCVAVTTFLFYIITSAVEDFSSSSEEYELPSWAINLVRWCKFLAGLLSFTGTASFLYTGSVRLVIFIALIFFIISVVALLYWFYERPIIPRWARLLSHPFFTNLMHLARGSGEQFRQGLRQGGVA